MPVCMAKTQYSLSDDPALLGWPSGFRVTVRGVRLAAGAGFVVVLAFVAGGLLLYRRERRRGRRAPQGRHSYIPRADMAFSGRNRV